MFSTIQSTSVGQVSFRDDVKNPEEKYIHSSVEDKSAFVPIGYLKTNSHYRIEIKLKGVENQNWKLSKGVKDVQLISLSPIKEG